MRFCSPLCVRSCFTLWCLPLALCFTNSTMLQHLSWSVIPGVGLSWPLPLLEQGRSVADVLCCIVTALLPKMKLGGSSLYFSYHGISPGWGSEAEYGPQSMTDHSTSENAGKDEFGQIETAKKLLCWTVWYQRLTVPPKTTRWVV